MCPATKRCLNKNRKNYHYYNHPKNINNNHKIINKIKVKINNKNQNNNTFDEVFKHINKDLFLSITASSTSLLQQQQLHQSKHSQFNTPQHTQPHNTQNDESFEQNQFPFSFPLEIVESWSECLQDGLKDQAKEKETILQTPLQASILPSVPIEITSRSSPFGSVGEPLKNKITHSPPTPTASFYSSSVFPLTPSLSPLLSPLPHLSITPSAYSIHPSFPQTYNLPFKVDETTQKDIVAETTPIQPSISPSHHPLHPFFHVTPNGVIEVLLRNNVLVQLTLDRAIRLVNQNHQAVVATNDRCTAACVHHAAAKVLQDGTSFEVQAYGSRRAKASTDVVIFSGNSSSCFSVSRGGHLSLLSKPPFRDLSNDNSQQLLLGNSCMTSCLRAVQDAKCRLLKGGALVIYVNSVKIQQSSCNDVTVSSERRRLRVSPVSGRAMVHTHFVDISVEADWSVRIRRGGHKLSCGLQSSFVLANEVVEFGLDAEQKVFIRPLMVVKETLIKKEALNNKIIGTSTLNKEEETKNTVAKKKTSQTLPKHNNDTTSNDTSKDIKNETSGPIDEPDKSTTDPKLTTTNNNTDTTIRNQEPTITKQNTFTTSNQNNTSSNHNNTTSNHNNTSSNHNNTTSNHNNTSSNHNNTTSNHNNTRHNHNTTTVTTTNPKSTNVPHKNQKTTNNKVQK